MARRAPDNPNAVMTLGDHLEELRTRLILALLGVAVGTAVSLGIGRWIIRWIQIPYEQVRARHPELHELVYLAPADAFIAYMKICVVSGLIISAPWVFYQIWMFVAAGLYEHERRYVRTAVPLCVGLFLAGALFFLFVIAPVSLEFFVRFGKVIGVVPLWMFQKYVSFMAIMTLIFGLAFQTPIAVFAVHKLGLVSVEALRSKRKFALFAAFAIAAIATPSVDAFSQVALAIPLYMLYEFGIILCIISDRRSARARSSDG